MAHLSNLMKYIDTELAPFLEDSGRAFYRAFKDHFKKSPDDFYNVRNIYLNFYFKIKDYIPILDISENETADDIDMQMGYVKNLLSKKLSHLFSKDEYCIEFGITYNFGTRRTYYTKKLPTNDAKNLIRRLLIHNHFITDDILEKYY